MYTARDGQPNDLVEIAKTVLEENYEGTYTVPSQKLYPHQWLWDSCFIAIGFSNYDIDRAQTEILSLLRVNGIMACCHTSYLAQRKVIKLTKIYGGAGLNPNAPDDVIPVA